MVFATVGAKLIKSRIRQIFKAYFTVEIRWHI